MQVKRLNDTEANVNDISFTFIKIEPIRAVFNHGGANATNSQRLPAIKWKLLRLPYCNFAPL